MPDRVDSNGSDTCLTEARHFSGAVPRRPVTIVGAEGARLVDDHGNTYIDCGAAHGWANTGHAHPNVVHAICEQAGRLTALNENACNDRRAAWFIRLSRLLAARFGENEHGALTRIAVTNSGTEAIEAAMKFARFTTGRPGFVAFHRGFHGRTMGALSLAATEAYRRPFEPLLHDVTHVPFNDAPAVERVVTRNTAAVILETIQGEAGVHEAASSFPARVEAVCRRQGALFIVDEIQTGFGRTGKWFATEHFDAAPDIVVLGKAMGGGIPMGAAVWRDGLGKFTPGLHGSTFAGNPLACAAGLAVIDVIEGERLVERAAALGSRALERLSRGASLIRQVRGRGLMIGLELKCRVQPVLRTLLERGVWALSSGRNVLRLLPPLVISESDLYSAIDIILDTLDGTCHGG